jgi:hypothetical protein
MDWVIILVFFLRGREYEVELPGNYKTHNACIEGQNVWRVQFDTSDEHSMYCKKMTITTGRRL